MVVLNPVTFSFMFFCISSVLCNLEPTSRCIPTTLVRGPCHTCMCTTAGVFQCRTEPCKSTILQNLELFCESTFTYTDETIVCTCFNGTWKTTRCQEKFQYLLPDDGPGVVEDLETICVPNNFYLVDCNVCRCDVNSHFSSSMCTFRRCRGGHKTDVCKYGDYLRLDGEICVCGDGNNYANERCLSVKPVQLQEVKSNDLSRILLTPPNVQSSIAHGKSCTLMFEIYYIDCEKCICMQDGLLMCTHHGCN